MHSESWEEPREHRGGRGGHRSRGRMRGGPGGPGGPGGMGPRRMPPSPVMEALDAAALPPSRLELEITESVLLQSDDSTLATLHELRSRGLSIVMDDFGTGLLCRVGKDRAVFA